MYRLLLVDDEPNFLNDLHYYISENLTDFDVDILKAANAREALELIFRKRIDIVITDICMPDMNGLALHEEIILRRPHCLSIFLTGFEIFENARKAVHMDNVVGFILKTEIETLTDVIKKAISKIEKSHSTESVIADKSIGKVKEKTHPLLVHVNKYIDEHISEEISLNCIASTVYHSPNYFSKLFKRLTGIGFCSYLEQKRMEHARFMLINSKMDTAKIASTVGYKSQTYFTRVFKSRYGITPGRYRKNA